jgi:hypothetical protein
MTIDPSTLDPGTFAFFGYPSRPRVGRDALANAAEAIQAAGAVPTLTWEQLDISGRLIIGRITAAIDRASVSVFDITTLNQNVMFEVGYAIGADRQLYLVRDSSDLAGGRLFGEVAILKPVGYTEYENSHDLSASFLADRPDQRLATFYQESIEPGLDPITDPALFYLRAPRYTEAEREIGRRIDRVRRTGIRQTIADPRESSVETLAWYAYHCYMASAVLVHLLHPGRSGADAHNARCALVAGIAHGMKRPVLMLAEDPYQTPIDYQELLYIYDGAKSAGGKVRGWLSHQLESAYAQAEVRAIEAEKRSLSTELAGLRLGEPIAENEADRLSGYFVSTSHYRDVLESRSAVFVGRKGAGKTANLMQAEEELGQDRRNLVCVIEPADYDLEGLVRLLRDLPEQDTQSYVVEALWKYLLISEIALAAVQEIKELPAPRAPGSTEEALETFVRDAGDVMHRDFTVRLERAVAAVEQVAGGGEIAAERQRLSEALHAGLISKLLKLIVPVLQSRRRVAVLIDNLDKAWDADADVGLLTQLLLGLLTTAQRVGDDIAKRLRDTRVTLGVFIRSDIYFHVASRAREPDKIPAKFLTWNDPHLLLEVIEERYLAGRGRKGSGDQLWKVYFDPKTRGLRTPDYMTSRVLPRPRDILYLTNTALEIAVRHRHPKVSESDVLDAEKQYSQFAFGVLLVEGAGEVSNLEEVLFEFAGGPEVITESEVNQALTRAGITETRQDVIQELVALSFLGRETRDRCFEYAENPRDLKRINAVAIRFASGQGREPRFRIHPAFQAYLDVAADRKQLSRAS